MGIKFLIKRIFRENNFIPNFIKRLLLRLAMGFGTYNYMCRSLKNDKRLPYARLADIVVRKDAKETRIEADWLRNLARIIK